MLSALSPAISFSFYLDIYSFRCYIVDDRGILIYAPQFVDQKYTTTETSDVSLAEEEGFLFMQLLKKGVFEQNHETNYQGTCSFSTQVPMVSSTIIYIFLPFLLLFCLTTNDNFQIL